MCSGKLQGIVYVTWQPIEFRSCCLVRPSRNRRVWILLDDVIDREPYGDVEGIPSEPKEKPPRVTSAL